VDDLRFKGRGAEVGSSTPAAVTTFFLGTLFMAASSQKTFKLHPTACFNQQGVAETTHDPRALAELQCQVKACWSL
jgi:hypothetical protein